MESIARSSQLRVTEAVGTQGACKLRFCMARPVYKRQSYSVCGISFLQKCFLTVGVYNECCEKNHVAFKYNQRDLFRKIHRNFNPSWLKFQFKVKSF